MYINLKFYVAECIMLGLLIFAGPAKSQQIIPLYKDSIPNSIGQAAPRDIPFITAYLPESGKGTGTSVIIFPGGAYSFLAIEEEGYAVARAFVKKGIAAFVVKYRLPNDALMKNKSFGPLQDAQQAIKLIRMNAVKWKLDSNRVGVIGYSAGGHLASTLGTHFSKNYISNPERISLRPDFMILVYPVISMDLSLTHLDSRINLLGEQPTQEQVDLFSNEKQVTENTPPTYLTQAGDDQVVTVQNSIVFYQALLKNNVPAELHLFPRGNHGFTQRLPIEEWLEPMLLWMRKGGWL